MSHAAIRAALHAAYGTRPKRRASAPKPRLPRQAELAYLKAAGTITDRLAAAVREHLTPDVLARYAAPDTEKRDARDSFNVWADLAEAFKLIVSDAVVNRVLSPIGDRLDIENRAEVARQLGMRPELLSIDLLHAMADWRRMNVALIKSVAHESLAEVREIVTTAAVRGTRVESLATEIEERMGVARSRAELIARDQILKQNAQLSRTRMQKVGVTRYKWSTSHDSRVRSAHRELDGNVYEFANPPDVGDGRRENPGGDFQCRCVAIPVFDD